MSGDGGVRECMARPCGVAEAGASASAVFCHIFNGMNNDLLGVMPACSVSASVGMAPVRRGACGG